MGVPLLGVCKNASCGCAFICDSIISVAPGATAHLIATEIGPCPKCGGPGLLPSGRYELMGSRALFTPRSDADRAMLERAVGVVREAIAKDMGVDEFRRAAQRQSPELSALWNLLPESKSDAYQFWTIVLAALGLLLMAYQTFRDEPPQQLMLPPEIVDAIQSARQ